MLRPVFVPTGAKRDEPAQQRDASRARIAGAQRGQIRAPRFAVSRDAIERMAAHADFEDFLFAGQPLLARIIGEWFTASVHRKRRRFGLQ